MANIDDFIEMAKNHKDAPLPDDYHDQLSTAYLRDMESRDEKIKALEAENAARDAKIKEYAVANFDLVRKASAKPVEDKTKTDDPPKRKTTAELIAELRK